MSHHRRSRLASLLLALCLNAAFIAMFIWQARPRLEHVPDPSRINVVWAVAAVTLPLPPPVPGRAASRRPENAPKRPATIAKVPVRQAVAAPEATPAVPETEAIVESDAVDPFEQPSSATTTSLDKAVMGKAIKTAMAERKALEDTQKFVKSGPGKTQYEVFADNVDEATIPYCYRADAMKHTPPVVKVGKVKIGLGSLFVLPYFAKAVATGKCRMK